jgi:hypothetical protein
VSAVAVGQLDGRPIIVSGSIDAYGADMRSDHPKN